MKPERKRTSPVRVFFTKNHKALLDAFSDEKGIPTAELIYRLVCKRFPDPSGPRAGT